MMSLVVTFGAEPQSLQAAREGILISCIPGMGRGPQNCKTPLSSLFLGGQGGITEMLTLRTELPKLPPHPDTSPITHPTSIIRV